MTDIASLCVADIEAKVKSISAFNDKVFYMYGEQELMRELKSLRFPCSCVVYEGMKSQGPAGGGLGADLVVTIMLMVESGSVGGTDNKPEAVALLDSVRNAIKGTKSPSNHKWVFQMESPADEVKGVLVYYQRWVTSVQLT